LPVVVCGFILGLSFQTKITTLDVFQNRALREGVECVDMRRREEVTGQRQLRNEELPGLYCPQNVNRDECELDEACKR
jgi:hypothetical protein